MLNEVNNNQQQPQFNINTNINNDINSNKLKDIPIEQNKINIPFKSVNYSLTEILSLRKSTFANEFKNELKLSFSTTVLIKTPKTGGYIKGKLIIQKQKFYVHDIPLVIQKKGTNAPIVSAVIDSYYHPILSLDFNFVTSKIILHKTKLKIKILILGFDKHFHIKFSSKEIVKKIAQLLYCAISQSAGDQENIIGVSLRKNFFLNEYIKLLDFYQHAKTGDLLIFKGFEYPARCQRFFTGAQYDHVALLVMKENGLHVYESTAKDGAKLRPWSQFLYQFWHLLYEKMVYRELVINQINKEKIQEQIQENTYEFIRETNGKEYLLKGCGFCYVESKVNIEKNNDWSKSKGFFCSQLVAAAYYKIGVMPYSYDSRHFLPGAFSQIAGLKLETGFSLGQELVIDFSS